MNNSLSNILIVGRPNVGKSTLFNTLLGKKEAITGSEYGLTRDYQIEKCNLFDIQFNIIDSAGYVTRKNTINEKINSLIKKQLEKADIILFVLDISTNLTSEDIACWSALRKSSKNIIIVANKSELKSSKDYEYQLSELGVNEYIKITAISKNSLFPIYNILKDRIRKKMFVKDKNQNNKETEIRVSFVGQPNVGKSTLYNLLYGEERVITAPLSGTTRDSVISYLDYKNYTFQLVDTAGLRRKSKINVNTEMSSAYYSKKEIRYANCVVLMIDSLKEISSHDITISNYIIKEGRSILLIFNKWDLIKQKEEEKKKIIKRVKNIFFDAKGINILFLSSIYNESRNKILNAIIDLYKKWNTKINTSELNKWFPSIWNNDGNQRYTGSLKFKYISQKKSRPPTFSIYHNKNSKVPKVTRRFIANKIREKYELEGVPIRINLISSKNPYKKNH